MNCSPRFFRGSLICAESRRFRNHFSAAIHSLIHVGVVCLRALHRAAVHRVFLVAFFWAWRRVFTRCAELRQLRDVRRNLTRLAAASAALLKQWTAFGLVMRGLHPRIHAVAPPSW
jgi:hypothetical protein